MTAVEGFYEKLVQGGDLSPAVELSSATRAVNGLPSLSPLAPGLRVVLTAASKLNSRIFHTATTHCHRCVILEPRASNDDGCLSTARCVSTSTVTPVLRRLALTRRTLEAAATS